MLRAGLLKRIHVVGSSVRANKCARGPARPTFTVQCGGRAYWCHGLRAAGPCASVTSYGKPRKNGAVVWLETRGEVALLGVRDRAF